MNSVTLYSLFGNWISSFGIQFDLNQLNLIQLTQVEEENSVSFLPNSIKVVKRYGDGEERDGNVSKQETFLFHSKQTWRQGWELIQSNSCCEFVYGVTCNLHGSVSQVFLATGSDSCGMEPGY